MKDGYKQVNKDEIDGLVPDGIGEKLHYRENCRNPGYIIFTVSTHEKKGWRAVHTCVVFHVTCMYLIFCFSVIRGLMEIQDILHQVDELLIIK